MKNPELKIVYNLFSVKTSFLLDGKQGYLSELEKKAKGKRIQQWIHDIFTPDLFDKTINGNELDFVFEGSDVEVEDVRDAVNAFNREYGGRYKLYADYVVHPLHADNKIQQLRKLFTDTQSGPFDTFRSPEMHQAFEKALSPEFEITVLATMSAGKSTVINAMVGKELLPSKNQACTATIARVINDDAMPEFKVRRLGEDDIILDDWQIVTDEDQFEVIARWNEDKDTSIIELKGNIPAIKARDGIQMVLVDTPGPNNSNDSSHRVAMERAIKSNQQSMVLYVLNATQVGVYDDQSLVNSIKEAMSKGGREAHDRFIFIVNKVDELDSAKETAASVLSNVKNYLETNGLINPTVIPVSAELTKLIRIKRLYGEEALTSKQRRGLNNLIEQFVEEDDMNLLEHSRHDLPVSVYQKLKQQVDEARHQHDDETLAELLSGIPIIEALLDDYLIKHAVPSRIKDAVQLFETVAHEQDIKQKLDAILTMSEKDLSEAAKILKDFNNSESHIQQQLDFRTRVNNLQYIESENLIVQKRKIDRKVTALFDDLCRDFSKTLEPSHADSIMSKADSRAKSLFAEIQVLLEEALENDFNTQVSSLKSDYEQYVFQSLGDFPDSENMGALKALQTASLEMPDINVLVKKATVKEAKSVFVGTERCGFLWLKKRNLYKTIHEDKVEMKKVGDEFEVALQNSQMQLIRTFDKAVESNFTLAKEVLIKHMEDLDKQLTEITEQINIAVSDKNKKQSLLDGHKKKAAWFKKFESECNAILNIKGE
ncbi:dynamin family protein [Providencia stuartii]|uniref:dynamin family protein n=1 Tax=Providencia stuartii TaxID=588 RepID=UPI0034E37B74